MPARSTAARIACAPSSTARSCESAPRNFPVGVRAPATITDRVDGLTDRVYGGGPWTRPRSRERGRGSGAGGESLVDHREDLVADELVTLHERLHQGRVDVPVLR